MSKRATQCQKILRLMDEIEWVTPMDAIVEIGCYKLSTRVGELIRAGFKIQKEMVYTKNRWGEPTHYMKYRLAV